MAVISFSDGSRCEIGPRSRVGVCALTGPRKGRGRYTLLRLHRGEILSRVQGGGAEFDVVTPAAVARTQGATFGLELDRATGEVEIRVRRGRVTVATPQGPVGNMPAGTTKRFPAGPVKAGSGCLP